MQHSEVPFLRIDHIYVTYINLIQVENSCQVGYFLWEIIHKLKILKNNFLLATYQLFEKLFFFQQISVCDIIINFTTGKYHRTLIATPFYTLLECFVLYE